MADYIGQVPEEVDALAADFETKAGDLEALKSAISAKLDGTVWTGQDRDRFQADWEGTFSQNITTVVQQLRQAGQQAADNAQQQRDASGS